MFWVIKASKLGLVYLKAGVESLICIASIFIAKRSGCHSVLNPVLDRWAHFYVDLRIINPPIISGHCIKTGCLLGLTKVRTWSKK